MSLHPAKHRQHQIMLSLMFIASLCFITLAASFAETPVSETQLAVASDE